MIFNLFKSKPTLKELIPNGFVDIHSHILPGIDDGAKNVDESKELIEEMKNLGFSKIIGTPHTYPGIYENTNSSIKKSFEKIYSNKTNKIDIEYASEYMLGFYLIEKAQNKSVLCLKDNHVLVEMSYISPPLKLYEIIFELIHNGYSPILAHPERYRFLHENFREYKKLKKVGCKFQINLLSTTNYYGMDIANITEKLLKNNMVDFLGSDIHNMKHINSIKKNKVRIKNIKLLENVFMNNNNFNHSK